MAKAGRKSVYESHIKPNFDFILGCLRSGHTEISIAKRIGVGKDTWFLYKKTRPEFFALIKEGGQDSTALVVNKLYQRATGYDYTETTEEVQKTSTGNKVLKRTTKKHVPSDVWAMSIILYNRDPSRWKNKQAIEHSGSIDNPSGVLIIPANQTREEWLKKSQQLKTPESQG